MNPDQDLSGFSMLDLFRMEAEEQARVLVEHLLALEGGAAPDPARLEALMRAAHSLKGAAAIVGLDLLVQLAHALEDVFVAAQRGLALNPARIDALLAGVDSLVQAAQVPEPELDAWLARHGPGLLASSDSLRRLATAEAANATAAPPFAAPSPAAPSPAAPPSAAPPPVAAPPAAPSSAASSHVAPSSAAPPSAAPSLAAPSPAASSPAAPSPSPAAPEPAPAAPAPAAHLPAPPSAKSLPAAPSTARPSPALPSAASAAATEAAGLAPATADPLLALASEMRIATRALPATAAALQRLKRQQAAFLATLGAVQAELQAATHPAATRLCALLQDGQAQQQSLLDQLASLDAFERRQSRLAGDLVHEVLALRMRPFGDGVHAFPRMVRDLARRLGKEARLVIEGSATLVDRDVLARIESPLNHLLRNAVDHGLEMPDERAAAGKPPAGTLTLTARHRGGLLAIELSDDGRGVDSDKIRARVIERRMATPALAAAMTQAELLDFLFLPAFSLKDSPTAISGRGVGLDLVQDAVRVQNGSVRLSSTPGRGLTVSITLPVTQSVVRALVCDIGGEPYAVPIAAIGRVLSVPRAELPTLEGKPFVDLGGERIGLVPAAPLLGLQEVRQATEDLPVLVLGPAGHRYGLVVEKLRGEASLVVQPLEPVFGKLRDLAAAAVLDDGSPVLILDVADLLLGVERQLAAGALQPLAHQAPSAASAARRVLVVDDSLTVREMERQLLVARGYTVDVAVDGMDGWNMVRARGYDLVITDVDMPRLDGIELTTMIRHDPRLRALPVMIVSYKDRPEDRARGLSAGADYYLTKGAFHDATLLDAVQDLIGGAA